MKRWFAFLLMFLLVAALPVSGVAGTAGAASPAGAGDNQEITATIDSRPVYFDVAPQKIGGRVMVPLRAIFESLGAEVGWEASTETITGTKDGLVVTLRLNDAKADVGGETVMLDVAATKIEGRSFVPARFVAESFGAEVDWNEGKKEVVIRTGAAAPEGRYYFVYNSQRVTAQDLGAIKLFANKFRDTHNVLLDAAPYRTASSLYDALKAEQKKLGGKVAGVQLIGIADDVPAFSYVHKLRSIAPSERWDGVEHNKNEKFATDFFYSTFKNDSRYLQTDITVFDAVEEMIPLNLIPEWPVSRLLLTKGEIAGYVERYEDYRRQTDGKAVPTIALTVPSNIQDGYAQNDVGFFMNRLKEEFGLFKNVPLRTYTEGLSANLDKEHKAGVTELMLGSKGDKEGVYQDKTAILDRKLVSSGLKANYYTPFFWFAESAKGLGTDNMIHDGLANGKMINPITLVVNAANGGMNNYVWDQVDETEDKQPLYWYTPVTYEHLQQNGNTYYYLYHYYKGLDEGKTRLQSFHVAKVEYANSSWNNRDQYGFSIGLENVISLHYLGLADYK